jgi:hypothetical protein
LLIRQETGEAPAELANYDDTTKAGHVALLLA